MKDKKIIEPKKFDREILGLIFSIAQTHDHPEIEMNPVLEEALNYYTDLHELAVKLAEMVGIYHPGCTNADCDACQLIDKLTAQQFRRAQEKE